MMKTYEFCGINLYIILFRNVNNMKVLREMLLNGKLECALIKAELICDPLQIATAGAKAVLSKKNNKLVTKNLYTETLFNLSPSKNITQSLKTFGVDQDDDCLMLSHYGDEVTLAEVISVIDGEQANWNELEQITKVEKIMKCYNIKEKESLSTTILDSVITRIGTKNVD